ncbi:hypothetical protein SprV_0100051600 [Sparganum proliferum]
MRIPGSCSEEDGGTLTGTASMIVPSFSSNVSVWSDVTRATWIDLRGVIIESSIGQAYELELHSHTQRCAVRLARVVPMFVQRICHVACCTDVVPAYAQTHAAPVICAISSHQEADWLEQPPGA